MGSSVGAGGPSNSREIAVSRSDSRERDAMIEHDSQSKHMDMSDKAERRVTGTVRHADGSATAGLLVQAFHRRVGGEVQVGVEALTDDDGSYTIGYQLPPGTSSVDLFVRGYDDAHAIVAVSPIAIVAGEREILDLTVTDPKLRGPSEFATATRALGPLVAGADITA